MLSGFTSNTGESLPTVTRKLTCIYEEESYLARHERVRGTDYCGVETAHLVSPEPCELPVVNKKIYSGTNRMKWFGPIVFLLFEATHHCMLKWKVKKRTALYCVQGFMQCGRCWSRGGGTSITLN